VRFDGCTVWTGLESSFRLHNLEHAEHLCFKFTQLFIMLILERTWKEEEAKKSQSPVPGQEISQVSQFTELTSSDNPSHETYMDVSSCRTKRSRASTDPATSERPSKLPKTVGSDFLRDYLPEVVDSHDRDDNMIFLTAPTFKEQILEEAKHDNGKYCALFCIEQQSC
jgi:hypothetical protein